MTKGSRSALGFACAATLFSASASAVTVSWVDGTGFWDLVANWSPSQLPSSADDVVINVTGQQTITHRTGTTQIRSLANTGDEIVAITNGSSLTVAANALSPSTNTGTLRVTGTGSRLRFSGSTLNNTGGTLDAQDGGLVELLQGTIIGGTLTTSGSGVIRALAGSYGTLDGVTLNGTYLVGDGSANSNSFLRNSLVNNGVVALSSGAAGGLATTLLLDGDVTVSGTGAITLSDSAANQFRGNFGTELLTNAAGHTIQGAGTINSLSITNRGTISATHATPLIMQPSGTGSVLNTGSLQAVGGGVLRLQFGTFTNFEGSSNGTIQAFDNSVVEFAEGSTVVGGILSTTGTGLLRSRPGTTSTLDGVTLNGNYVAGDGSSNTVTRLRNTITNNGTLRLNSGVNGGLAASLVLFQSDATLTGNGTLTMANGTANSIYGGTGTERLTNSAGHTIQGAGNIGAALLALTNQGLIAATQATPLIIQPNSSGVINTGTLRADGGTLDLRGLFTNAGGTLDARNGSVLQLTNATVTGGTLQSSNGGLLRTTPGTVGRLDGVTLNGTYVAGDGSANTATQLVGTITNNGTLAMNSGVGGGLTTSLVLYQSDVTLAGNGTLAMANSTGNVINDVNGNEILTNAAGHTIQGAGRILVNLQNAGTVRASGSAGLLANRGIIGPSGTIEIAPDGILTLAAASSAGTLLHNGSAAGSLALGANSVTIHGDYNNANFGLGNAFNARANVSGTGQVLAAGNTMQAITGAAISNGTTATPTLTIGNVRVGANTFDFQVANTGTTGPTLRGAIQTAVNGGNITDPRLAVAPQNFGPIAVGGSSGNLGVSFNVASAGALAPLSGQAIHVANNFGNVPSQTINLALGAGAAAYVSAAGKLNTPALNFGTVQVGQGVSQSLSISNIATGPAGYVEDLNAVFGAATGVGASLITGSGSISGLLAGATNASNMVVSVNTSAAGTVNGAIPVNFFTAGAVNGASNGLGTAAVGSANFGVSGTIQTVVQVVDQAIPVVNNPVIDLGNIRIGSASPTQFVSVTNQATGNAQAALNAGISASAPVTASGSFNLLAPGGTNASALQVGLNTSTAGARSGTATVAFVSDASNVGGCEPNCQLTLASQNVTVQGNVFRLADPVLGTSSISLAARVGDAAPSAGVVLSNSSPDIYTEGLSSAISTAAAGFSASGAIANLAAGASNASTLRVQLDTSTAGTFGGTAELALASTGAGTTGAADLALPGQSANLSGKVYTPAVAQVATASIDFGIVHVGDAVASQSLTVTNAATQSALNDVLRGAIGGVAGPFTASGTLGDGLAAGQTDSSSLAVSLGTAAAGIFSGSATASFVSHDADLVDLGLGTTSISLAGQVNNYADPRFIKDSGAGTLTSAALIYQFDFGTLSPGSGLLEGVLTLSNAAAGPADLLRGSYEFDFGSSQDFGLFGFQSFNGLAAGQGQSGLRIAFNTDGLGLGTYEDTIRLLSVGYNNSGYEGAFSPILLLVRGTVGAKPVPEPGTLLLLMYGLASLALACSRRSAAVRRDAATMAPDRKARNAC